MSIDEYWNLTIGEISRYINAKLKSGIRNNYNLASLIASFVNISINGKSLPTIERLYPSLFFEEVAEANDRLAEAQFKAWAMKHNKQRSLNNDS